MPAAGLATRLKVRLADFSGDWRLGQLNRQIFQHAKPRPENPTIAFFNVSTRLSGVSLNAAFAYLAACGLQLAGYPVVYFACQAGMTHCVLGTNPDHPGSPPPCRACQVRSERIFSHAPVFWFRSDRDESISQALRKLNLVDLSSYERRLSFGSETEVLPLGSLVLPSLRWALRRHHLVEDGPTLHLFREYIHSAWQIARSFAAFLDQVEPQAVVLFNGVMYPEATAAWIARRKGLRVITHEVGFRPFTAFFSHGEATEYPLNIPDGWSLDADQERILEGYLEKRFQGEFTMAGIRFWPEMHGLSDDFNRKAKRFRQIVPVFTNVIYDTSQVHANTVFPHMFAWLDLIADVIKEYPDTLFVIRAHPDEMRPGKESRDNVPDWVKRKGLNRFENVEFIGPNDFISSYELIHRSKFVMVYNSSIGLEASLLGKPVLCGAKARYTPFNTVFFPLNQEEYRAIALQFLRSEIPSEAIETHRKNARRVMFHQLFQASLPFDAFLEEHIRPGFVRLKSFGWQTLTPEESPTIRVLIDGIVDGKPFVLS